MLSSKNCCVLFCVLIYIPRPAWHVITFRKQSAHTNSTLLPEPHSQATLRPEIFVDELYTNFTLVVEK
jgi:hypothetical protein